MEEYVLFFSVVRAVRVHAYKINRRIHEQRINPSRRFDLGQALLDNLDHPLNQAVLYHEGTASLHRYFLSCSRTADSISKLL
jgi:hypothetical protein